MINDDELISACYDAAIDIEDGNSFTDMVIDISTKCKTNGYKLSEKQRNVLVKFYNRNIMKASKPTKREIEQAKKEIAYDYIKSKIDKYFSNIGYNKYVSKAKNKDDIDIGDILDDVPFWYCT